MKRFSALILALVLIFALALTGCSNGDKPSPSPSTAPSTEPSTEPSTDVSTEPSDEPTDGGDTTGTKSIADFWQSIVDEYPNELPGTMELTDEDLQTVYGIDASKLEEYTAQLPLMNVHATEFFIAKVKDGEMDAVKEGIASRLENVEQTWSQYLPDQYELVKNHQLVEEGNYILFVISDKAEAIADSFRATYGD